MHFDIASLASIHTVPPRSKRAPVDASHDLSEPPRLEIPIDVLPIMTLDDHMARSRIDLTPHLPPDQMLLERLPQRISVA